MQRNCARLGITIVTAVKGDRHRRRAPPQPHVTRHTAGDATRAVRGQRFGGGEGAGSDWEGVCWEEGSFDRVMCDVPCSGFTVMVAVLTFGVTLRSALGLRPRLRVGCTAKQLHDLAM